MATPSQDRLLTIGDLASIAGVSSRTIRYYEELGILPEPERSPGGTRRYSRDYRFYIEGALALKELGFSLEEIQLIGRTALGRSISARDRRRVGSVVSDRMANLEHKIHVLQRLREILQEESKGGVHMWTRFAGALDGEAKTGTEG